MARGTDAKLRRKNERKEARALEAERLLNGENVETQSDEEDESDDDSPYFDGHESATKSSDPSCCNTSRSKTSKVNERIPKPKQIKTLPLIILVLLFGTAMIPALIYVSDFVGSKMQNNNVMGSVAYKLGMGASPKKRVLSFYEKHDPIKIQDVDSILGKYYGKYPRLVKKLERKYQDYGYFIGWEKDDAPMILAKAKLQETFDYGGQLYQRHAPRKVKRYGRNAYYNLNSLYKKGKKVWRKTIWPIIEPVFGVPDGGAAQKRKDARDARRKKKGKRNAEYRDEEDEF